MSVFFSNKQEILFDHLKRNLFFQASSPFQRRILIVPNQGVHTWIRLKLVEELGIACGIETLFLDQAVEKLTGTKMESELALILKLEKEVRSLPALSHYLEGKEKRVLPLCKYLARLFKKWTHYQFTPQEGWQLELWQKIHPVMPKFERLKTQASIHLFCFNHLSPFHFSFFQNLSSLFFYHLSPCQEFWSDMKNPKGRNSEEFLEDHHPLLSNLGTIGRNFAWQIEESSLETVESYEPSNKLYPNNLGALQDSMLFLAQTPSISDDSIQIHQYTTPYKEVEGLFKSITHLMLEKQIEPKEIIVMAPDISHYEPFIHAIFDGKINYTIEDLGEHLKKPPLAAFFKILSLENKRWRVEALLELFKDPIFQVKQGWNQDELELITKWVKQGGILWGYDCFHVEQILKAPFKDGRSTWKEGMDRLLLDLSFGKIPFSEAIFLGEWITLLTSLYQDLRPFYDGSKKSFHEWKSLLSLFLEKYLGLFNEFDSLFKLLEEGHSIAPDGLYPFSLLEPLLREKLERKEHHYNAHHLQAIRFCSMLPMRGVPAEVIVLLGMNDGSFPRKERWRGLDPARKKLGSLYPTTGEFDRYLFLEALLSARSHFILSYIGMEALPSSVLSSFMALVPQCEIKLHPDSLKTSLKKPTPLISTFTAPSDLEKLPEGKHVILLKDLITLFSSPLKYYLKKKHGLYLKKEKEEKEFLLSPLQLYHLRREWLVHPPEKIMQQVQKKEGYPLGHFNTLAREKIAREVETLEEGLKDLGLKKEDFFSLVFTPQVKALKEIDPKKKLSPPLIFQFDHTEIEIWGELEYCTPDGLFLFESFGLRKVVKHFPKLLIINKLEKNHVIFGKERQVRDLPQESNLKAIFSYYFHSFDHPSLLLPDWVEGILEKDEKLLEKAYREESFDEERKWIFREESFPKASQLIEEWGPTAHALFGGVKNAWF